MNTRRSSDATFSNPEPAKDTKLKRSVSSVQTGGKNQLSRMFVDSVEPHVLNSISPVELKRQQIIHEIFLTEKQYVNDLKLTIRCYLNPIRQKQLLTKQQVASIFGNIEALVPINEGIYNALNKRKLVFGPVLKRVGDIFLANVNLFKMYAVYCSTNRFSSKRLKVYRKENEELDQFLKSTSSKRVMRGLHLQDFLILPLQRICKYPLLFKNLLEETPREHPDYKELADVKKLFGTIVKQINERTRQVENVEQLTEIVTKYKLLDLGLDIVSRDRELAQEERVTVYKNKKELDDPHVILLFNDQIILLTEEEDASYKILVHVPLTLAFVSTVENSENMLQITHGKKKYSFRFAKSQIKDSWLNNFNRFSSEATSRITRTKRPLPVRSGSSVTVGRVAHKGSFRKRIYETMSKRGIGGQSNSAASVRKTFIASDDSFLGVSQTGSDTSLPLRPSRKPRKFTKSTENQASVREVISPRKKNIPSIRDIFESKDILPSSAIGLLQSQISAQERISTVKKKLENLSEEQKVEKLLVMLEHEFLRCSDTQKKVPRENTNHESEKKEAKNPTELNFAEFANLKKSLDSMEEPDPEALPDVILNTPSPILHARRKHNERESNEKSLATPVIPKPNLKFSGIDSLETKGRKRKKTEPHDKSTLPKFVSAVSFSEEAEVFGSLKSSLTTEIVQPTPEPSVQDPEIAALLSQKKSLSSPTLGEESVKSVVGRLKEQFSEGESENKLAPKFSNRKRSYRSSIGRVQQDMSGWATVSELEKDIAELLEDRANLVTIVTGANDLLVDGEIHQAKELLDTIPLCPPNIVHKRAHKFESAAIRLSGSLG